MCALILRELNQIFIACWFQGSQEESFFLQTLLFTAFLVTVLKILTYALVSTWSLISSRWEHVKRKMHSWMMNAKHHDIGFQFVSTQRLFPWHFMILNMHWLSQACPVCPSRELYIWGSSCYTRVTHTNIPTSARQHKIPKSGNFVNESCCW